jgi:hypothetical protein
MVWILPFMEQQAIYSQMGAIWLGGNSLPGMTIIKTYQCPSDPTIKTALAAMPTAPQGAFASYGANAMVFGNTITTAPNTPLAATNLMSYSGGVKMPTDIPDGVSNTIFWSEKLAFCAGNNTQGGTLWADSNPANPIWFPFLPLVGLTAGIPSIPSYPTHGIAWATPATFIQPQYANNAALCLAQNASTGHAAALLVGMGDGSSHIVNQGISAGTFTAAMCPNENLPLPQDW